MLRGRYGPWQTQGCSEVPDPTKQRALPHQENTDLSASGAGRYFITAAEPFHTQRVGNAGDELSRKTPLSSPSISTMEHGLSGVPINIRVAAEENGLVVQDVPTGDLEFIQEEKSYGLDHCCNERWFRYADWMLPVRITKNALPPDAA